MEAVRQLRTLADVTQSQLAKVAGTSQPTIAAYESGTKSPTYRTLQRMAGAVGLELHPTFVVPMTREERRSLELHRAIAVKLAADPGRVVARARRNVKKMRGVNPGASRLLDEWRRLLQLSPGDLADVLIDPTPRARELRHVTPFAGVLTPAERWAVYRRFRSEGET